MKVALVAFRYGPSHGSILQTFALTRVLESMGHQVTIIDRQRPIKWHDVDNCFRRVARSIIKGKCSVADFYLGSFPKSMMDNLNVFIDEQLRLQTISFSSERELKRIGAGDYDAYIVGSDQTWRPKYVYDVYNYFLDFVPVNRMVKRVAYAPSFGTKEWEYTQEQESKSRKLLSVFNGVSVREDDGVILCKKHFSVDAKHVLDPTMLLKGADYLQFVKEHTGENYIGYNFLDLSPEKMAMVEMMSKSLGLASRQLISMGDESRSHKERIAPSINDWLSGIYNSQFVLVDSFHATVFCILFHKNFVTIGNVQRGLSRFTSLLKMVGLENRLVTSDSDLSKLMTIPSIDWNRVEEKVSIMRESSIDFLKTSLE